MNSEQIINLIISFLLSLFVEKLIKTLCATPIYFAKDEALFQRSDKTPRSVNDPEINSLCWGSDRESDKKTVPWLYLSRRENLFRKFLSRDEGKQGKKRKFETLKRFSSEKLFSALTFFLSHVCSKLSLAVGRGRCYQNREKYHKSD